MPNQPRRIGLAKIEVLVTIIVVVVVLAIVVSLASTAWYRMAHGAESLKDKTQIQQIHKAVLTFAADHNGLYPTPGVICSTQGTGVQDFSLNHSAPLYSYLVASQLLRPEQLVSPSGTAETSAVRVKLAYNFNSYNPAANQFWDPTFTMRIDDANIGANCSYAHAAICGDRRDKEWRDTRTSGFAVIGTRGTRGGVSSGPEYDRSPTRRFHGMRTWIGHVCFADNHCETLFIFYAPLCVYFPNDGTHSNVKDNIYAAEFSHPHGNQAADDSFLGVFAGASEFAVNDIYDPLE